PELLCFADPVELVARPCAHGLFSFCDPRARVSAAGEFFQPFRIAVALHRDSRDGALDLTQIVGSQFDGSGSDVLLQAAELRGTWDRHDPRLLREWPGDGNLSGRHLLPGREFAEQLNERLVRPPCLRCEAGNDVAEVSA